MENSLTFTSHANRFRFENKLDDNRNKSNNRKVQKKKKIIIRNCVAEFEYKFFWLLDFGARERELNGEPRRNCSSSCSKKN